MSNPEKLQKSELLTILLLSLAQFTYIVDFMIVMPLGVELMDAFQISPAQFSYIVSSYTISSGIFVFLAAFFIDRFDRKNVLLFAYLGFLIGTFACGIANSYIYLLVARAITGAFGGMLATIILSIIGDLIPFQRRGKAMGFLMGAFSAASVLGVPIGYVSAIHFGWHMPFFSIAAVGIFIFILSIVLLPSINGHKNNRIRQKPLRTFLDIFKDVNQSKALLFMAVLILGQFTIIPFITPYMRQNVGFTENQITYIYLFGGGLTIFTAPLIGRQSDKRGVTKVFIFMALISLIPILAISNMPAIPFQYVLIATSVFFVFISGRMIPAVTLMTSVVGKEKRGSFMSFSTAVRELSMGVAAMLSGWIVFENEDGLLENYNLVGFLSLGFTVVAIFLSKRIWVNKEENT